MKETKATLQNLVGTNRAIGEKLGRWALTQPQLLQNLLLPPGAYLQAKLDEIQALLHRYNPGVNEEIEGFAQVVGITPGQASFYAMTYLERGCSLMAMLPHKTAGGHTLMGRSYDFNDEMEEMCFAYTELPGKHRYIASTLNLFGRGDGMNEHGLAACQASNGLPVGNFPGAQKPGATGFAFWVVIRGILENCRDVPEALAWTMAAPIGYNINLMLADAQNRIALVQCIDGHMACKQLAEGDAEGFLSATNHALLPEVKPYEKMLLENSVIRNNAIAAFLGGGQPVSNDEVKGLLTAPYPEGLCCHYYGEYFGTLRSMLFDVTDKTIEMTFGSPRANGWRRFAVAPLEEQALPVRLPQEKADGAFYNIIR